MLPYRALRFCRTVAFSRCSIFLHNFTVVFITVVTCIAGIVIIFFILVIRFSLIITAVRSR